MRTMLTAMAVAATLAAAPAVAQELASGDEAKALFDKAMAYYQENGRDAAFAAFNDPEGEFVDRDLYVFCLDFEGGWHAMGAKPELVGRSAIDLKDKDGKFLVKEMIEVARNDGTGVVNYTWPNPVTGKVGGKSSYIQRLGDEDYFCGMGYYQ